MSRPRPLFRVMVVSLLCCIVLIGAGSATDESPDAKIHDKLTNAEGETVDVIVRFGTTVGTNTVDSMKTKTRTNADRVRSFAADSPGVEVKNELWLANAAVVTVDTTRTSLNELASVNGVERIHPNFKVRTHSVGANSNSAVETSESGASRSVSSNSYTYGLDQIDVPETWSEFGTRGEGTKVAVLDTGVNPNHPDIELYTENPSDPTYPGGWAEFDSFGDQIDSEPYDSESSGGHGTHVSGTVTGGNASGEAIGVAPEADLMHGLVLPNGSGYTSQIVGGMQWAVDNDAEVISMSLGGNRKDEQFIQPIRNAQSQGVLVVASSGNSGDGTSGSPGNVYDSISVGASDSNRNIAGFSSGETIDTDQDWNDPPSDWPDQYVVPDVAAPGSGVKSADSSGSGYLLLSGTSMAAPHVSGAAALMESATSTDLTPEEIRSALQSTAKKPNGWGEPEDQRDTRYGYGIIDAYNATVNVTDVTEPDPPSFQISALNPADLRVAKGYNLSLVAEVTNTGGAGDAKLQFAFNGTRVENRTVTVDTGETVSVAFSPYQLSVDTGEYEYSVSSQNDTQTSNLTVVDSVFSDRLITTREEFRGPPTNTTELHPTLYEDLSGNGDGIGVDQTVMVFAELIRGRDLNLTDEQARKLNWNADSPETEVTIPDLVSLFGKQIRAK